ncbi:hypothetical protein DXA83_22580, partial [Bacteroides thetaiotaomicron]
QILMIAFIIMFSDKSFILSFVCRKIAFIIMFSDKSLFCHLFVERLDLLSCLFFNNLLLVWKDG